MNGVAPLGAIRQGFCPFDAKLGVSAWSRDLVRLDREYAARLLFLSLPSHEIEGETTRSGPWEHPSGPSSLLNERRRLALSRHRSRSGRHEKCEVAEFQSLVVREQREHHPCIVVGNEPGR